jgi:hypothetical protein
MQSDAYGTGCHDFRIGNPTLTEPSSRAWGSRLPRRAVRNRTDASAPRTPRYQLSLLPVVAAARKGGDDPPPPGPKPGVLPVTPLPNGASPEGRTPMCGIRGHPVASYCRYARVGGEPGPREPLARLGGPRRTRTFTGLLVGEVQCRHSCSGPKVRGAGVEPAVPEAPGVTTRCRPTTATRGWDRYEVATWHGGDPIPLLVISSVVKELLRREEPSPFRQMGSSHSEGPTESNPIVGGLGGRPATGASPLRVFCFVVMV